MTWNNEMPDLESGIPPPPFKLPALRGRSIRGISPWKKLMLRAVPGQSFKVGYFNKSNVLTIAKDLGIEARCEKIAGEINTFRIWLMNVSPKQLHVEENERLRQAFNALQKENSNLRDLLAEARDLLDKLQALLPK